MSKPGILFTTTTPSSREPAEVQIGPADCKALPRQSMIPSNKISIPQLVTRTVLIVIGLLFAWRIVVVGMAQYGAGLAEDSPHPNDLALAWLGGSPEAMSVSGQRMASEDPERAEALLRGAYRADPSDGGALIVLAMLWLKQGQIERADKAAEAAARLSPANITVQLQMASYWLTRGKLERTLNNWNRALQIHSGLSEQLFPILLSVAENRQQQAGLRQIVAHHLPPWWEDFFVYATQNAARVDTLRALYGMGRNADRSLSLKERNAYVKRLQNEGLWGEAYISWFNDLTPEQLKVLGQIYDGGFEQTRFEGGFDWDATKQAGVDVEHRPSFDTSSGDALHVQLYGTSVQAPIVAQFLFLQPGHYRFSGSVKTNKLESDKGLVWVLSCATGEQQRLAATERFVGSNQWRRFSVSFRVPANNCSGQRLQLQVLSSHSHEFRIHGEAWFDDLAIEWLVD